MTTPPAQQHMGYLLTNFTHDVQGVAHAIAVSSDGLLLARSADLPADRGDQLAAIAAGVASLTQGAAGLLAAGAVRQNLTEMEGGLLFLMTMGGGAIVALAGRDCDAGQVGYELSLLIERVGDILAPEARAAAATSQ